MAEGTIFMKLNKFNMKKLQLLLSSIIIIVLFSCQGNKSDKLDDYVIDEIKEEDTISDPIPESSETIDWKDGNTYSYNYTEEIIKTDSLGNEQVITVYKRNQPSDGEINCEPKVCKWCSNTTNANNYSIEEYPNINWLRGQPDLSSIMGMLTSIIDGNSYYDLDNNRVRTEWRTNCEYNGPNGFCSEKCKSEYSNR